MMTLAKTKIENVTVELTVEETIGSGFGGYPTIHFGSFLKTSNMVQEVNTLAVIKAIATSETVEDFSKATQDCWNHEIMVKQLKAHALDASDVENGIIKNCEYNLDILENIHRQQRILRSKDCSDEDDLNSRARIYDLRKQLIMEDI